MAMRVNLDDEHTKCSICISKFSSDRYNKNPEINQHLPVLSSSQRCDHWFCHGCILREQQRVAEENNGRIPKWIKCMHCKEKTSFNPAEPKYHRLLIDLLDRAQRYEAPQVKKEEEKGVHEDDDGELSGIKGKEDTETGINIPTLTEKEKKVVLIQYKKDNDPSDAEAVLAEYEKFMHIKIKGSAPSKKVNAMWHAHILSTYE
eukprot:scaffold249099_cov66-Cyclotella_meneghiniana.AAC.1